MTGHRKVILCGALIFIAALISLSVWGGQYTALAFTDSELKTIETDGKVSLTDDSFTPRWQTPKNNKIVLSQVVCMLKKAREYHGGIPKSAPGIFMVNLAPSTLHITMPHNEEIIIQPESYLIWTGNIYKKCFVDGVILVKINKQITYIQSNDLYKWLKNNEWRTEF